MLGVLAGVPHPVRHFRVACRNGRRRARLGVARAPIRKHATTYKSIDVNGLSIFYREAGSPDAPTLLLLHGFPSSSRMYEPLFTRLADAFHLVAPDYPGFGNSDAPDSTAFDYTFDNVAQIIERFTELMGIDRYSLFLQDYGGPVGFRLALANPGRLTAPPHVISLLPHSCHYSLQTHSGGASTSNTNAHYRQIVTILLEI